MKELIEKLRELETEISIVRDEKSEFQTELSDVHRSISELLTAYGRDN